MLKLDLQLFGGRGASSGMSNKGRKYGTQFQKIFEDGNIKFVENTKEGVEPLMETMTKGRIYVQVGGREHLLRIIFFDETNRRNKVIEYEKRDKQKGTWHVHHGYFHTEYDPKEAHGIPTAEEQKIIDKVEDLWHKWNNT